MKIGWMGLSGPFCNRRSGPWESSCAVSVDAASLNVPKALGRACLTGRNNRRSSFENEIFRDGEWNLKSVLLLEKQKLAVTLLVRISLYVLHCCMSFASPENTSPEDFQKIASCFGTAFLQAGRQRVRGVRTHSGSAPAARFHKKVGATACTPREGRQPAQHHRLSPPAPRQGEKQTLLPRQDRCCRSRTPPPPASRRAVHLARFFLKRLITQPRFPLNQPAPSITRRRSSLVGKQFSFDFHPATQDLGSCWEGPTEGLPKDFPRLRLPCLAPGRSGFTATTPAPPSGLSRQASSDGQQPFCWCCRSLLALHGGHKLLDKYHQWRLWGCGPWTLGNGIYILVKSNNKPTTKKKQALSEERPNL